MKLIDSDPKKLLNFALSKHEDITGERLSIASEKAHLYSTFSYLMSNILYEMNDIALQNYLPYARGKRLDLKGELFGERGDRIKASYSKVVMQCNISEIIDRTVFIKKGTRFINSENIFYSLEEGIIKTGELFTTVLCQSEHSGNIGIILAGEITQIIDKYDFYQSCFNVKDVVSGGDIESDNQYTERLKEIPESFTCAGSEGAYKFWIKQSSQLVNQVIIKSPTPNVIDAYVYGNNALISDEEKKVIKEYITKSDRLPLNDLVTIKNPDVIEFDFVADFYLYENEIRNINSLKDLLETKIRKSFSTLKIGESINLQDIIQIIKNENIKKCTITSPGEINITSTSILVCKNLTLEYRGTE